MSGEQIDVSRFTHHAKVLQVANADAQWYNTHNFNPSKSEGELVQ